MSKKQPPQRQKRGISLGKSRRSLFSRGCRLNSLAPNTNPSFLNCTGPVYQIRTPSFNFEEAAKYQVFIEDEIGKDLYQQYARQQPKSK